MAVKPWAPEPFEIPLDVLRVPIFGEAPPTVRKISTSLPINTEALLDCGWTEAYPTWADAESTPMWQFEDEVMLIPPTWRFELLGDARFEAANEAPMWLDDEDEAPRGRLARLIDRIFNYERPCDCINCRDEGDD